MSSHVTSADGTRIAFDVRGEGEPLILIAGIFCTRKTLEPLAERLAGDFAVFNYDRRGRGGSTDTAPYAVEREIEDLAALIGEAGGSAAVYGHSSGAGLALEAAAAGLPITRLILHEPPYAGDDPASRRHARESAEQIERAIAEQRPADAMRVFFAGMGMPDEVVDGMVTDPGMLEVAPTMPYDHAVMGDIEREGVVPVDLVRAIEAPTLVLAGTASPDFFLETAARLAELLPAGETATLEGEDHGAPAEVVAPRVAAFAAAG